MKISIIGCGRVGKERCKKIVGKEYVESVLLYSKNYDSAVEAATYSSSSKVLPIRSLDALIDSDFIIITLCLMSSTGYHATFYISDYSPDAT